MSTQNATSPAWLAGADGIAARWQDFLLLVARVLMGWIFLQRLAQADGHSGLRENHAAP